MKEKSVNTQNDHELIYQLEGKPSLKIAVPLGLQHVLSMFVGNITPILILIGLLSKPDLIAKGFGITDAQSVLLIQAAMLASGLTTMLQLYPIKIGSFQFGAGLPIVMGTSFAFVPTATAMGPHFGFGAILGACLVGSIVTISIGFLYKYLRKVFSELVIGCVLVTIGIHLLKVGSFYFAGGALAKKTGEFASVENLSVAFAVFAIIILLQKFGKGIFKLSAILIAIVIGYIASLFLGKVNLDIIKHADWFGLPIPPFTPLDFTFEPTVIISFALIYVIVALETIGNTNGITVAAFDRPATEKETSGGILADGLGCLVASFLNALPNTAFGQNAGIVAMTKIVNKWCIAVGGFILIATAFIPKLGAVFRAIPDPVLGGAVITVFAMILINGIKLIAQAGFSNRNLLILGITFGIGYGLGAHPDTVAGLPSYLKWIFQDTVACVCIVSIIATLLFPEEKEEAKA